MTRRARLWALLLPPAAGGVLVGHDAAYRLAGVDPGGLHTYLAHAPQLLLALCLPGVLVATRSAGGQAPRPHEISLVGIVGFALLEHIERIAHGELPWLLTSPVFLLGLALQLPVALAVWWLASALLALPAGRRARPRALAVLPVAQDAPCAAPVHADVRHSRSRGPPRLL